MITKKQYTADEGQLQWLTNVTMTGKFETIATGYLLQDVMQLTTEM